MVFFRSTNAVIALDLTRDLGSITGLFYATFALVQIPIDLASDRFGLRVVRPVLLFAVLGSSLLYAAHLLLALILAQAL